jgi:hypothetical protein
VTIFGLVAVALVTAGIATSQLPDACGEVGRPNLDFLAKVALVTAAVLLLPGVITSARARAGSPRLGLMAFALAELAAGIAVVLYYRHQRAWYGHCG